MHFGKQEVIWNLSSWEEEKEWMYQILEEASRPYLPESVLEQTVKEVNLRVLDGELTPEEGAAEVAGKMAIEMEK